MWIGFEQSTSPMARLRSALAQRPPRMHVYSPELESRRYLDWLSSETMMVAGRPWQVSFGPTLPDRIDIFLVTGHAADFLAPIWNLRRQIPEAVFLLWQWDNHHDYLQNLRTVLAVDGYFPGHGFCVDYLMNPYSANLGQVPLCCGQWSPADIAAAVEPAGPRSDKFLAAYANYAFSARHAFLKRLEQVPEGEVLLMSPLDQSRYFAKSKAEQLAEWCGFKSSAVVPVERDLSNRVFDALACGQIPLVSDAVLELDRVIAPALQAELPILRFRDGDLDSLLAAHAEANRRFDAAGAAGIRRRHGYALGNHMLHHRLATMLTTLVALDEGRAAIFYHQASGGLVLAAAPGTAGADAYAAR